MSPLVTTIAILIIMVIMFMSNRFPLGLCGMFCSLALLVTGVLEPADAFSGFANTNVVIMVAMMIVSAGLMKTSLIERVMGLINKVGGGSQLAIIAGFGLILAIMAQFMNAFVAISCMIPFINGTCDDMHVPRTKVYFPLMVIAYAFVALLPIGFGAGNFAQMNGYLEAFGSEPLFTMWTLTGARLPSTIAMTLFAIFVLPKFCPDKPSVEVKTGLEKTLAKSNLSKGKETLAYVITIGTILMMMTSSLHGVPAYTSASIGAFLMVLTGILTEKECFQSVSWNMVFMFAGILPLATALTQTGASDVVANALETAMGGTTNPWVINIIFGVVVWLLTQIMSNTAMINVFTPLALLVCSDMGMNPVGIMGIIYIAATASFMTPMASPGVPLAMGAAGYDFRDTMRLGLLPAVVSLVVGVIWCSLMFPAY